jgi:hypothetical protein
MVRMWLTGHADLRWVGPIFAREINRLFYDFDQKRYEVIDQTMSRSVGGFGRQKVGSDGVPTMLSRLSGPSAGVDGMLGKSRSKPCGGPSVDDIFCQDDIFFVLIINYNLPLRID